MSILDFFKKGKTPTFKEYASNKHLPAEMLSREQNSEFYKNQLVSLTSAFFLNQAVSASAITGLPVTTNLAQNAKYSCGVPFAMTNPHSMGIYSFSDYCNAVKVNPHLNNVSCSHNQNIFASNFLNNPNVAFQNDINCISVVYDAVLATFAGESKDTFFGAEVDTSTLQFASMQYSRSPETFFVDDYFMYPNGLVPTKNDGPKQHVDKLSGQDPSAVGFALEILTRASGLFQQTVYENTEDFAMSAATVQE
ncbi:MAG: hypothetical protein IJW32_02880 [Clostridia bacterium]|nr:hypothetical protein [Clostridia bacterium]